jgi:hypothetical protein
MKWRVYLSPGERSGMYNFESQTVKTGEGSSMYTLDTIGCLASDVDLVD